MCAALIALPVVRDASVNTGAGTKEQHVAEPLRHARVTVRQAGLNVLDQLHGPG